MILNTNSQKYRVYIKYQPPGSKFLSVLLYDQLFSRKETMLLKFGKIGTKWPQSDFEQSKIPVPYIYYVSSHEAQIFIRFDLQQSVFKIQGRWKLAKTAGSCDSVNSILAHVYP